MTAVAVLNWDMRSVIQFLLTKKPNESQPIFMKFGLGHVTTTCGSN